MNDFEKLSEVCNKQRRGLFTSQTINYISLVITEPETLNIEFEVSGTDSLNTYAGALLGVVEIAKLELVH